MSFVEAAPLFCAGATMYNAILTAKQPQGAILGIVGLGALGHLGVQVRTNVRSHLMGIPHSLIHSLRRAWDMWSSALMRAMSPSN